MLGRHQSNHFQVLQFLAGRLTHWVNLIIGKKWECPNANLLVRHFFLSRIFCSKTSFSSKNSITIFYFRTCLVLLGVPTSFEPRLGVTCYVEIEKKITDTVHQKKVCTQGCFYVLLCSATLQKSPIKNNFFVWLEDFHFFHEKSQGYIETFLFQWLFCDPSYEPTRSIWKWGIT